MGRRDDQRGAWLPNDPGQGLRACIADKNYSLGSRQLLGQEYLRADESGSASAEVWVAGPDLLGRIIFHDAIRPEAAQTLQKLESIGVRTVMLTGDRRDVAEQIARGVGIGEIRAHSGTQGTRSA